MEGGELNVLLGTDFSKLEVAVILIETMHDNSPIRHLQSNGYTCEVVGVNNVCAHESFTPSVNPAGKVSAVTRINGLGYSKSLEVVYI